MIYKKKWQGEVISKKQQTKITISNTVDLN